MIVPARVALIIPAPVAITLTDRGFVSVDSTATSSLASGSFTPAAGSLLVVISSGTQTAIWTNNLPTDTFTGTSAWTQRVTQSFSSSGGAVTIWTALAGATPGSGTVTASRSSNTVGVGWSVNFLEVSGQNATPTGATGSATTSANVSTLALTMSAAPAASSLVVGAAFDDDNIGSITPPSGWTDLHNISHATDGDQVEFGYKNGSSATTLTWSTFASGTFAKAIVALEIVSAGGGVAFIAQANRSYMPAIQRASVR